jgi:hypothetical protein
MNNISKLERQGENAVAKFKKLAAGGLSIAAYAALINMGYCPSSEIPTF